MYRHTVTLRNGWFIRAMRFDAASTNASDDSIRSYRELRYRDIRLTYYLKPMHSRSEHARRVAC